MPNLICAPPAALASRRSYSGGAVIEHFSDLYCRNCSFSVVCRICGNSFSMFSALSVSYAEQYRLTRSLISAFA
jgi:hypothetical protein